MVARPQPMVLGVVAPGLGEFGSLETPLKILDIVAAPWGWSTRLVVPMEGFQLGPGGAGGVTGAVLGLQGPPHPRVGPSLDSCVLRQEGTWQWVPTSSGTAHGTQASMQHEVRLEMFY